MQVQSLGQEDLLEKEMATHSSTLAWKIPWAEEPGRLQSMDCKELLSTSEFKSASTCPRDVPCSPVVMTLCSHRQGSSSIPGGL